MAIDSCQNFVPLIHLYLKNEWMEFDKTAYALILTRFGLVLICINLCKFVTDSSQNFVSAQYLRMNGRYSNKFCIHFLILTRSRLGLF